MGRKETREEKEGQGARPRATAEVRENKAFIDDQGEASLVYNKGCFGQPQSGGSLILDPLEAVYLLDVDRIVLDEKGALSREDAMRWGMGTVEGFEVKYLVYREMRQRGYVVKDGPHPVDFRVFPRGGRPNKNPSKYWLKATSERWPAALEELRGLRLKASNVKKNLLMGVADEEGDVTYYAISDRSLQGDMGPLKGLPRGVYAHLLKDRVMVFDVEKAEIIHREGWYGQLLGPSLQLSILEASYLASAGVLELMDAGSGEPIGIDVLEKRGEELQDAFQLRRMAYTNMRDNGLVVKTGFKYGAHFRVYDGDPSNHHARFLVHVVSREHNTTWPELSRAVRLAQGVKKELLLASPIEGGQGMAGGMEYTRIRRLTP
ncbi:MAG: tRNA-intron lyase [Thermoplasmata archaeon]|nr:tRNA-intron lyase [Thermoplasmata archaeon]